MSASLCGSCREVWETSYWKSVEHTGSLLDLSSHSTCSLCKLILHLFTSNSSETLALWPRDKPPQLLREHYYSITSASPTDGAHFEIKIARPGSTRFEDAGTIELFVQQAEKRTQLQKAIYRSSNLIGCRWFAKAGALNYRVVRSWLKECNNNHSPCQRHSEDLVEFQIRLIDVIEQKIVSASTAFRYLALSYVWGGAHMLKSTAENISDLEKKDSLRQHSNHIPWTVKDAMHVVAKLGERFLWVDALCIVQNDQNDKHVQISQMHEIYSAAYATIVQQSGNDADAGLPGVRPGTRSALASKSRLDDTVLVSIANYDLANILKSSVHSSRGWTLQEILLSKRCLHFFDKQLAFVCAQTTEQDFDQSQLTKRGHMDADLEAGGFAGRKNRNKSTTMPNVLAWQLNPLQPFTMYGPRPPLSLSRWLSYFGIYSRIVRDYSSRRLSYSSDVLAAFSGLTSAMRRLYPSADGGINAFKYGLPTVSFDLGLLWIPLEPPVRRTDAFREAGGRQLPSWCWAGWDGPVAYNCPSTSGPPSSIAPEVNSYIHCFRLSESRSRQGFVVISREPWPPTKRTMGSLYFQAYRHVLEPEGDPVANLIYPPGCLHFWAEELCPSQVYCKVECPPDKVVDSKREFPFLFTKDTGRQCGILAMPSPVSVELVDDPNCSFILLSEVRKPFLTWSDYPNAGAHQLNTLSVFNYYHWDADSIRYAFNVLLVQRSGLFVTRLAFGQIFAGDWLGLQRRRRYIRMV